MDLICCESLLTTSCVLDTPAWLCLSKASSRSSSSRSPLLSSGSPLAGVSGSGFGVARLDGDGEARGLQRAAGEASVVGAGEGGTIAGAGEGGTTATGEGGTTAAGEGGMTAGDVGA